MNEVPPRHPKVTIEAIVGDITRADAEAIVNAANSELWMGGGVAGAIKVAGGLEIESEAIAQGPIRPGEAVATSAGRLSPPIRMVIHAATMGPDLQTSEALVRAATGSALAKAVEMGAASIALPAMGTGVGGFPMEHAAAAMVEEVVRAADAGRAPPRVTFVLRTEESRRSFIRQISYHSETQEVCPNCHQLIERVPIVYGYPTAELGEEGARGEVVLGGCHVQDGQPKWACPNCRHALRF